MKSILFTLVFCVASFFCEAQVQIIKDSLSFNKIVGFQQKQAFENYEVKFKDVIADSRCPKSVMGATAGEAYESVSIYKNGDFIEDKKIRIEANGYVMESTNLALMPKILKSMDLT